MFRGRFKISGSRTLGLFVFYEVSEEDLTGPIQLVLGFGLEVELV
jgi:hypothetical protein